MLCAVGAPPQVCLWCIHHCGAHQPEGGGTEERHTPATCCRSRIGVGYIGTPTSQGSPSPASTPSKPVMHAANRQITSPKNLRYRKSPAPFVSRVVRGNLRQRSTSCTFAYLGAQLVLRRASLPEMARYQDETDDVSFPHQPAKCMTRTHHRSQKLGFSVIMPDDGSMSFHHFTSL